MQPLADRSHHNSCHPPKMVQVRIRVSTGDFLRICTRQRQDRFSHEKDTEAETGL